MKSPAEIRSSDHCLAMNARIAATAIRQLPEDRQALLSLAYIDGESRQSLSERFGVPVGTIKTWLRRTLETVRTDCAAFEAQAAS